MRNKFTHISRFTSIGPGLIVSRRPGRGESRKDGPSVVKVPAKSEIDSAALDANSSALGNRSAAVCHLR